ncbi:MAG: hypothetical protein QOH48_285 [Actinomycetota bacterium]|jgi:hypothetical protein|nr:hypothetical protein [Actinomycetota bacterium]
MRRLSEPEAHRGRMAIIEGRFPEGMTARCSWCGTVQPANDGEFLAIRIPGTGPSRVFRCGNCRNESAA